MFQRYPLDPQRFPRANPGNLGRLQMETPKSGFVENKGVPARKRIGTLQFPIGDDVSALTPAAQQREADIGRPM
jgi:hypothetical protein